RMTWPMHDAGSTTPDPGRAEATQSSSRPRWGEEPGLDGLEGPKPGAAEPSRRGRHAAPDPLPPIEGPMPGGGPSPAETTLALALKRPAPPTRPHRSPPPGPPGWRRVPRTSDYAPPNPAGSAPAHPP